MAEEIPLYDPTKVVGDEVVSGIREVLSSGWLTLGPKTEQFESMFSSFHDSTYGIAMNSCTSALYASLRAIGIGPSDTVVVPALTFAATANVVRLLGGEVLLCDVKENGNIDPVVLRELLEVYDVDAVIPVHLYGLPCDMSEIVEMCDKENVPVVEDCAHAPGARIDGRPVGSFGDAGCFSFYATKNMTTGEGGMVITDDDDLAERITKLRNHHQTKSPKEKMLNWGYDVDGLGFNFRMSEIQAVIGLNQLDRLQDMTRSRREVAERYLDAIDDIDGLRWSGGSQEKEHVFHLFVLQVLPEYPLSRNQLYERLSNENIVTGVHYPSISALTYYDRVEGRTHAAERLSERILSLPMYPNMKRSHQEKIADVLAHP